MRTSSIFALAVGESQWCLRIKEEDKSRTDHDIDLLGVKGELAVARIFQIDHDIHKGGIDMNIDMWDNDVSFDVKATFTQAGHFVIQTKEILQG